MKSEQLKGQNIFVPVDTERERLEVLSNLVRTKDPIQIKASDGQQVGGELTVIKPIQLNGSTLLAQLKSGPSPKSWKQAVIIFSSEQSKYFCRGGIILGAGNELSLSFDEIYKLQRRDYYRVPLPSTAIVTKVTINQIEDRQTHFEFGAFDLSSGGIGVEIPPEKHNHFSKDCVVRGVAKIGDHSEFEFEAVQKFSRKFEVQGKIKNYHHGLEFTDHTIGFIQKVSAIVNDCQRIIFSKLKS